MIRVGMRATALVLAVGAVTAQPAKPVFDAVSIRGARSGPASVEMRPNPSGLTAINATALDLIRFAFEVIDADVIGDLPGWIRTKSFDLVARSADEALTYSRLRLMARALLQDRFRLDVSAERVEVPVYALVMERSDGKAGPNLRPSTSASTCIVDPLVPEPLTMPVKTLTSTSCGPSVISDSAGMSAVIGSRITMQRFARTLSRFGRLDRPVVDQTGLSGEFDILALVSADMGGATGDARFLTAMREQLGLTLRAGQGTLDVLRIRRIEQPSPN